MRKFADEQPDFDAFAVYNYIKTSNSSLKRRPKKLLEDSIDRVLLVLREEQVQDDGESLDGDFDGIEEAVPQLKVRKPTRPFGQ